MYQTITCVRLYLVHVHKKIHYQIPLDKISNFRISCRPGNHQTVLLLHACHISFVNLRLSILRRLGWFSEIFHVLLDHSKTSETDKELRYRSRVFWSTVQLKGFLSYSTAQGFFELQYSSRVFWSTVQLKGFLSYSTAQGFFELQYSSRVFWSTVQLQGFFNFSSIPVGNKTEWND